MPERPQPLYVTQAERAVLAVFAEPLSPPEQQSFQRLMRAIPHAEAIEFIGQDRVMRVTFTELVWCDDFSIELRTVKAALHPQKHINAFFEFLVTEVAGAVERVQLAIDFDTPIDASQLKGNIAGVAGFQLEEGGRRLQVELSASPMSAHDRVERAWFWLNRAIPCSLDGVRELICVPAS